MNVLLNVNLRFPFASGAENPLTGDCGVALLIVASNVATSTYIFYWYGIVEVGGLRIYGTTSYSMTLVIS